MSNYFKVDTTLHFPGHWQFSFTDATVAWVMAGDSRLCSKDVIFFQKWNLVLRNEFMQFEKLLLADSLFFYFCSYWPIEDWKICHKFCVRKLLKMDYYWPFINPEADKKIWMRQNLGLWLSQKAKPVWICNMNKKQSFWPKTKVPWLGYRMSLPT